MPQSNREAFLKAKKYLKDEYSDSEIYLLLIDANKFKNYTELVTKFDENLANPEYFSRNLKKMKEGVPIQYIIGTATFHDFDVIVTGDTLIPRVETEGLVKLTYEKIIKNNLPHKYIADICSGTGCIAIYMKKKFSDSIVYAIEKYVNTYEVGLENFKKNNVEVIALLGSRCEPLIKRRLKLDVLISNPPYVEKMDDIEEKVKKYEPFMNAIYLNDGTKFYDSYFRHHKEVMNKKFLMAFEINYDQEEKLTELIKKYFDLSKIKFEFVKDIYGLTRYLFIEGNYD